MAAALSNEELQLAGQQIAAHPEILQAFKAYSDWASHRGRLQYVTKGGPPNPQAILQQYGIRFPDIEDYQIQVDPQGNVGFKRQNWLQRNMDWVLPVATIATGGAANALTGGTAAADSVLPATQTVTPVGQLAPEVASSLGTAGTDAAATAGATAAGEAAANAGADAASTAPDVLPSTQTVPPGGGTLPSGAPSLPPSAFERPDLYDKITGALKSNWKDILSGGADAVAAATQAAASNRATRDEISERANRDYETALLGREGAEQKERNTALDNVYRNSWYTNRTPGPNNTRGVTPMTPDYMATLGNLAQQGNTLLASAPQYGMTSPTIDPLTKFKPSNPSTMETIGNYAGPIMKIISLFGKH